MINWLFDANIRECKKINRKLNRVFKAKGINNKNNNTFLCKNVTKEHNSYTCYVLIPLGLNFEQLEEIESTIKTNFASDHIEFKKDNRHAILKIFTK